MLATPRENRQDRIQRTRARYRGTAVVHALLDEYWKIVYTDPDEAGHLAELAWVAAKFSHEVPRIHELVALTASCIGNAARASGNLPTADRWFGHVRELLDHEDVRTLSVLARIDCLEGSLRKDQRRFPEAVELLSRALTLFRLTGMRLDVARTLLTFGATRYAQGRLKDATEKAREALLLVDRTADPRLYLLTQHNLALYLSEQGRHQEAAEILNANMDLYQAHGDAWTTLHAVWVGGRITAGLGYEAQAEESFRNAREGFLIQGNAWRAAIVCLDLALLYLKQGRTAEVQELAEAMVPVFEAQGVHREAMAAWLLFREAAERETLTAAFVKRLARYLEAAKVDPTLKFESTVE